jgi:hypothetical protein
MNKNYQSLIECASEYLRESYSEEQICNFSDEEIINELFGGAGLVKKIAKDTNLQQQLGNLAAAQAMKSKGAQQAFVGDVRANLRSEKGLKGFLTRNIAGVENIRLKRRVEALKALQATPDIKSTQPTNIIGTGNLAAQQQRKAFGSMSVEKDLVRQAGAQAIKDKANKLLQQNPRANFDIAMKILKSKNVGSSSGESERRLNRIRQTGLGPSSLYKKSGESELSKIISFYKSKNKQISDIQRDQDQDQFINRLAARDADIDRSEPSTIYKPIRPISLLGKRKLSSTEVSRRRKNYLPDNSEPVEESKYNISKMIKEAVDKSSMKCNKPVRSTSPGKKMMVKACEGGQEKIVHFGAKGYGHNYSGAARKSFRARHKCGEKKSKLSAQYWACKKLWAGPKGSKASCPPGRKCKY